MSDARTQETPRRPAELLPPSRAADRPLFLVVAIIAALAGLSLIGARTAWSATAQWTAQLDGSMTVFVQDDGVESAQNLAARVAEIAERTPGVRSARAAPREEAERLLQAWLGSDVPGDLPVPALVDIRLSGRAGDTASVLQQSIDAAGLNARVDDHGRWSRPLRRMSTAARTLAISLVILLTAAAAAVTSFATRASLAARRDVVDVLHLVGAHDAFIAREFTRRFRSLGLRAGALGALAAAAIASLLQIVAGGFDPETANFAPAFALTGWDAMALGLAPFAVAAVAALTARATVLRALRSAF